MTNSVPTKQLKPKPRAKRAEEFRMRDKMAVLALHVPGLIVDDERNGTTDEILAVFEIDHELACTFGGTRAPQNGRPLRRDTGEHKAKSAIETRQSKRCDRIARTYNEWWQRVMAGKAGQSEMPEEKPSRSKTIRSRGFPKTQRPLKSRSTFRS